MDVSIFTFILLAWYSWPSEGSKIPDLKIDSAKSLSPKKIKLKWSLSFLPKRPLTYIVRYKTKTGASSRARSKTPEVVLKQLKPDTEYTTAVRAVSGGTRGAWSDEVAVKTKSKFGSSKDAVKAELYVDEIEEDGVALTWNVSGDGDTISHFSEFQIFLKSKEHHLKRKTAEHGITITGLKPENGYAANLFGVDEKGNKIRLGRIKFQTLEKQMTAPRKLKVKNVTHKSVSVKWRHIKTTNDSLSGYILEYKQRSAGGESLCNIVIDSDKRAYKVQGLQEDTRYMIRVAGLFNNVSGPFSDWLRVSTLRNTDSLPEIIVYHIYPNRVLLSFDALHESANTTVLNVQQIDGVQSENQANEHSHFSRHYETKSFETNDTVVLVEDLIPDTNYEVTLTAKTDRSCINKRKVLFKTLEAKCFQSCTLKTQNQTDILYESQLRIIPLPKNKHLVVWDQFDPFDDNDTAFDYVINLLGEPFLFHLSSHLIPDNQHFKVLENLHVNKTYTITLQVFSSTHGGRPYATQHLLVHPYQDLAATGHQTDKAWLESVWHATSMDTLVRQDAVNNSVYNSDNELDMHIIPGTDFMLMTRLYHDDNFTSSEAVPQVIDIPAEEAREGSDADVLCYTVGDPYPEITFLNISSNQVLGEEDSNVNRTVYTVDRKYVGSSGLVDGRVFMAIRAFITFKNITIWDSGQYACVAENEEGEGVAKFNLQVLPKPPKKIVNLFVTSLTPFQAEIGWTQADKMSHDHPGRILGYHVTIKDEFDVVIREQDTSNHSSTLTNLHPDTLYNIQVSAYNQYDDGEPSVIQIVTPKIPRLGPPQSITSVTLNNSTILVSWLPPKEVVYKRVRLRGYIFQYREAGTLHMEEMQLNKQFTNVSMIGLKPDSKYEAQVIAMSEDAQISNTEWLQANTSRESYMNESVEPPPPHNVFLNLQSGNIIVSWLPPFPNENIIVRGYVIDVFFNMTKLQTMEVGYKESSVIIYDVEMGILYRISVRAKNRAGLSLHHWEELKIPREYVTKAPVENFRGNALSSTHLELSWDPPTTGVFSRFVLSYTLNDEKKPELPGGGIVPASVRSYIVRSLQPYTGYIFFITPYLKDIPGITTNTTVTTFSDKPSSPPENITLAVINSTTIKVQCNPPSSGKNGPIILYRVLYKHSTVGDSVLVTAEENENLNYYLTGLDPDTIYEIRVRAMNVNGSGPWSTWVQERTAKREPIMPKAPRNLSTTVTSKTVTLTWLPPDQDLKEITGFVVGSGRFIPEVTRTSLAKDKSSFTFQNLEPRTVYIVSVRSFNDFGESEAIFDLVTTL